MKLQFIASVAAVLLNSSHGVFAAKDEPKGLRGSLDFLEYYKSPESRCYDRCCDYAGEDQVLLGSLEFYQRNGNDGGRSGGGYCDDGNECQGVFEEAGGYDVFCRDFDGGEGGQGGRGGDGGEGRGGGGGGGGPGAACQSIPVQAGCFGNPFCTWSGGTCVPAMAAANDIEGDSEDFDLEEE